MTNLEPASPSLTFLLRPIRLWDIPTLLRLDHRSFDQDRFGWPTFMVLHWMGHKNSFIAHHNNQPAGYISTIIYPSSQREPFKGYVASIAVLLEYRRRGLATLLMRRVMTNFAARGQMPIGLHVRVYNTPAITLYERLGFVVHHRIAKYYQDGTDGYVMLCHSLADELRDPTA